MQAMTMAATRRGLLLPLLLAAACLCTVPARSQETRLVKLSNQNVTRGTPVISCGESPGKETCTDGSNAVNIHRCLSMALHEPCLGSAPPSLHVGEPGHDPVRDPVGMAGYYTLRYRVWCNAAVTSHIALRSVRNHIWATGARRLQSCALRVRKHAGQPVGVL